MELHEPGSPFSELDRAVMTSPDILGRECAGCFRVLAAHHFRKDSSSNDGRYIICNNCEATPKMSIAEHTLRMREINYNRESVKRQRFEFQDEYRNDKARMGKAMHSSEFILKLKRAVPNLLVRDGRIKGHLALYELGGAPREDWGGLSYRYLFYFEEGIIPEFSILEFDSRDCPIREKSRGWRTVLLRLIVANLLTEAKCEEVFGQAEGVASIIWYYKLYLNRNREEKKGSVQ